MKYHKKNHRMNSLKNTRHWLRNIYRQQKITKL